MEEMPIDNEIPVDKEEAPVANEAPKPFGPGNPPVEC